MSWTSSPNPEREFSPMQALKSKVSTTRQWPQVVTSGVLYQSMMPDLTRRGGGSSLAEVAQACSLRQQSNIGHVSGSMECDQIREN